MMSYPDLTWGDPWQLVTWVKQLEELTGLAFGLLEVIPPPSSVWKPEFRETSSTLCYQVTTPAGEVLGGTLPRESSPGWATARRLVSLASGQLRAELAEHTLRRDVHEVTSHTLELYEQVSTLHQIVESLSPTSDPTAATESLLRTLTESLAARDCDLTPLLPRQRYVRSTESDGVRRTMLWRTGEAENRSATEDPAGGNIASGQFLAVEVHRPDGQPSWLTVHRDLHAEEFLSQDGLLLGSAATLLESYLNNHALLQEKDALLLGFVRSLVTTLDARDHYTCGHSERVAAVAALLASRHGLPESEVQKIHTSGLLHDIGKIGIEDAVLRKPGKLTEQEWREVQRHPVIGDEILAPLDAFADLRPGVRFHHEAWDGSGYPDGLANDAIPLMARILAVADAFDAMASDRPYREGMPLAKVSQILLQGRGEQWCPDTIDLFHRHRDQIINTWLSHHSRNREAREMA
ncbi:MAG: HD-GYP domain-containing protein [Planctomycetaceae bacterium]|nr:HD-GYP domain-containing protein [Planctomycetaceae bacterium]